MKQGIKRILRLFGLEIRRIIRILPPPPGSPGRPVSQVQSFLEDIRSRDFSPRGIIDVGAHRGNWTRMILSVFPQTPVIMIEPLDEMVSPLAMICAELPNCTHIKAGAGRERGELTQGIHEIIEGSSYLVDYDEAATRAGTQRLTTVTTIDSLLAGQFPRFEPDLVKLDIQGFELEALAGGSSLFGRTEVFIIETSLIRFDRRTPLAREVLAFMAERGYELYDITECLRRPHDGCLGQVDFAFVKASGRFRKSTNW